MKIELTSIGIIHFSPFKEPENMPIQPAGARGVKGSVEVSKISSPDFRTSTVSLISSCCTTFTAARDSRLRLCLSWIQFNAVSLPLSAQTSPNPIGLSVVRLDGIDDGVLYIRNVDILDNTRLLDIKPYVPEFQDPEPGSGPSWLEKVGKPREAESMTALHRRTTRPRVYGVTSASDNLRCVVNKTNQN